MTLDNLRTKLKGISGPGSVFLDWSNYLNENNDKEYPLIIWSLTGAKFNKDARSNGQKVKTVSFNVFAVMDYDQLNDDQILIWDALETKFDTYINKVNETSGLQVLNIDKIEGEYFPEGLLSIDSELGIGYKINLKVYNAC